MYFAIIQQFKKTLGNLDAILTKAERHAESRKFDPNNYLVLRLAPDMFPLVRQVQMASDAAKVIGSVLLGREVPVFEDSEKTVAELHERVRKTIAYLETLPEAEFAKVTDTQRVPIRSFGQTKHMTARDALLQRALPNFFFHITTAYDIIRHAGVEVGKMDYLGTLTMAE